MDQNSTDDDDKRNWRQRLGIGNKEMPRISGEFNKSQPSLSEASPPLRGPQPVAVAKLAPMAPRVPAKAGDSPQAARDMPSQNTRPLQSSSPQAQDSFAEKLRSQRAAAEKLAEQRVAAARQRAEDANSPPPKAAPPKAMVAPPLSKPKFTFAEEDMKPQLNRDLQTPPQGRPPQRPLPQSGLSSQLTPPRPALGAERPLGQSPRLSPPPAGYQPQYRPQQPPLSYRPTTGYTPQPSLQPPRSPVNPLPQSSLGEPSLQSPRLRPDAYRRPLQDDLGYGGDAYEQPQRALPRHAPMGATQPTLEDEYGDEIFEDTPPPRTSRRASATDYNQAYRETEDAYDDGRGRSSGPWLLLLLLMLAAGVAGAGVWYYQTSFKSAATASSTDTAPIIAAPEQSAKVAPEQPATAQPDASGATSSKKQIYDRIIGDKEVLGGQVVPTEETPIQPEAQQGDGQQIPQPAGNDAQPASGGSSTDEALPLPMPPPPGTGTDTQGAIPAPVSNQSVALAPPASNSSEPQIAVAGDTQVAPVPGENGGAVSSTQAAPPSIAAPAKEEIVTEEPVPVKKKAVAKTADTTKIKEKTVALGSEPVVLVPPSDSFDPADSASAPIGTNQPSVTQPVVPVVKKKKTLFGLFNGTNDQVDAAQTSTIAPTAPPAPSQQVASLPEPLPNPAPLKPAASAQAASGASGYYVQLASFKSEAEASSEYTRMKLKHADIIGSLPPVINPASVGGSTRYRLAVGPLSSREQAVSMCSSLVAAGERDCLVRHQ